MRSCALLTVLPHVRVVRQPGPIGWLSRLIGRTAENFIAREDRGGTAAVITIAHELSVSTADLSRAEHCNWLERWLQYAAPEEWLSVTPSPALS